MKVVIQVRRVNQKRQASLTPIQHQRKAQVEPREQTIPGVSQAGVDPVEVEPREQTIPEVIQAGVDPLHLKRMILEVENWNTVFQYLFQDQILIQDVQVLEGFYQRAASKAVYWKGKMDAQLATVHVFNLVRLYKRH